MGRFKNAIDAANTAKSEEYIGKVEQLENIRTRFRQIGGQVMSLGAEYYMLQQLVEDVDDQTELDARKIAAITEVKGEFAAIPEQEIRDIINGVLQALITE